MEADGREEIEQNYWADAGDFYVPGDSFGPSTFPNSNNYADAATDVAVSGISWSGDSLVFTARVGLGITVPTISGTYPQNTALPVSWTTSSAVSTGQFAVWVRSASGWYVGKLVAVNGTASYATSVSLAVPAGSGYSSRSATARSRAAAPGRSTAAAAAPSR